MPGSLPGPVCATTLTVVDKPTRGVLYISAPGNGMDVGNDYMVQAVVEFIEAGVP